MKRLALITGAATGLGRAIAERLAADGIEVVIGDVNDDGAQRTADALCAAGFSATAMALDVGDEHSVAAAYAEIERRFGRLDILVNNAGIAGLDFGKRLLVEHMSLDSWERTLKINLTGTLLMCRGAIPLLRRGTDSSIVNISSRVARTRAGKHLGSYAASKAATIGLSQVLAGEIGPYGVTVNCVAPSSVRTEMTMATSAGQHDYFERAAALTAVGRLGQTEDVSEAVAFLCSSEARFITGTVIDVNGGSYMP